MAGAGVLLSCTTRVDPPVAGGVDLVAADDQSILRLAAMNLMLPHVDGSSGIHLLGETLSLSSHKMAAGFWWT